MRRAVNVQSQRGAARGNNYVVPVRISVCGDADDLLSAVAIDIKFVVCPPEYRWVVRRLGENRIIATARHAGIFNPGFIGVRGD